MRQPTTLCPRLCRIGIQDKLADGLIGGKKCGFQNLMESGNACGSRNHLRATAGKFLKDVSLGSVVT